MRTFFFKEMLLVSFREKKARRIRFDPQVTVIRGENETGKSCLIKSIFQTFGAEPAKVHPRWVDADVRSLIRFEVDGRGYALLRCGDVFGAFDGREQLLGRFQSVTKELGPFLSDVFGFSLKLVSRKNELVTPPPAFYFLPFYMDQDVSWGKPWAAFARLTHFANWRPSVIQYHAGIRGNDYYEAQAVKIEADRLKNEARRTREGLEQIFQRLGDDFPPAQFNVDFSKYEAEITELLAQCDLLRTDEEAFKGNLFELRTTRRVLQMQLDITERARTEVQCDYEFAVDVDAEDLECPTCGAHYTNSFAERFSIAVDEDRCASLALSLAVNLIEIDSKITMETERAHAVADRLDAIEGLLAVRRGEVKLGDLIRQEGRNELSAALRRNVAEAETEEGRQAVRSEDAEERMKLIDSRERRKQVNALYETKMRAFLNELDVRTVPDKAIRKVDAQIHNTGSELPRTLLASQMAFVHVVAAFGTAAFAPLVIDSPNQQDQDSAHLVRMLAFIRDQRPSHSQLILGLVDAGNVRFGGSEIVLDQEHSLLLEKEYPAVGAEVQHFIDATLRA